jgi:hypothetical protein
MIGAKPSFCFDEESSGQFKRAAPAQCAMPLESAVTAKEEERIADS